VTATLFGIDPTFVPAVFGFIGSLVGAGAAIGAQWLSQAAISNRETDARLLREKRVRKVFAARIKGVALYFTLLRNHLAQPEPRPSDAKDALRLAKETLATLALDFANTELLLSLEPNAIERVGFGISSMQTLLWLGDQVTAYQNQNSIDELQKSIDELERQKSIDELLRTALFYADEMHVALGEPRLPKEARNE
jgi:hypothetical protein